jgi:hypothetical protein
MPWKSSLWCKNKHYQTKETRGLQAHCLVCKREKTKAAYSSDPARYKVILQNAKRQYEKRKNDSVFKWQVFVSHLKRQYGLSEIDYLGMLWKSKGRCYNGFCRKTDKLCVDHHHTSGRIRGLLCDSCNRALGLLQDSPSVIKGLKDYLQKAA